MNSRHQNNNQILNIAVVGHTNTGKTSLMRTLLRDDNFGEISNRPSTTRHVEASHLIFDETHWLNLHDTPGMEDSMGLLEEIDDIDEPLGIDRILSFLSQEQAEQDFAQESKVLRQVLSSDLSLYIIDAREPVLGKYQDELKILSYSAKPIMPVLNFIADNPEYRKVWHEHLAKLNLHAVIDFDTVAYSFDNELSLYRGLQTLIPEQRNYLESLIIALSKHEQSRIAAASKIIAELLIDVAAFQENVSEDENSEIKQAKMQNAARKQEQKTVKDLLDLFQFFNSDFRHESIVISNGEWQRDLFDLDNLKDFGFETGSAMAKGAAIGLSIDVFTGGLSMGAASLLGAAAGAIYAQGRNLVDMIRGHQKLRIDDNTIGMLALRQSQLAFALLSRGHASQSEISLNQKSAAIIDVDDFPQVLVNARVRKDWSHLNDSFKESAKRDEAIEEMALNIQQKWQEIRNNKTHS